MYSGVVYLYISPEDKVYVGVTINERQRRSCWFRAGDYAGFRIAAARRKYPPELWEYRVLSRVSLDSLDALLLELSRLESYFIKEFRSSNPAFGYNVLSGGVGFHGLRLLLLIGRRWVSCALRLCGSLVMQVS